MDEKKICTCGNTDAPPYCESSHENALSIPGDFSPIPGKILLMVLPYEDGETSAGKISSFKDSLETHGYCVKIDDANAREEFKKFQNDYFRVLKKFVGEGKDKEDFVIAPEVMRDHLLAHIDDKDEEEYSRLLKAAVDKAYSSQITDEQIMVFNFLLGKFFSQLVTYLVNFVKEEKPEVLGFFVSGGGIAASMYGFRVVKECFPRIMTVLGGSVFTDYLKKDTKDFDQFLSRVSYIDKILIGDGEALLLQLLQGQLPDEQRVFP
jgi:hypothetical protein